MRFFHKHDGPEPGTRPSRRSRLRQLAPRVEGLEARALMSHVPGHAIMASILPARTAFVQTNLVTNNQAVNPAAHTDPNLTNPWGIAFGPASPFWVADNHSGRSTFYDGSGAARPLVVTIPPPAGSPAGKVAAPTGIVFNGTSDFALPGGGASRFIFATEDGTIAAWGKGTSAELAADRSSTGAVYKGLAMANNGGSNLLFATNFNSGKIDVFDKKFAPVTLPSGAFTDNRIPSGYAPFGIANIGNNLVVTYARQDAEKHDDAPGRGRGFVDVFDPAGNLLIRAASRGSLNSPWGLAIAPASFGRFANDLLVGDFGDGRINAYRLVGSARRPHYQFAGQLPGNSRRPIAIEGLWALTPGNGAGAGNTNALYFTAGPNGETDGLFGSLSPAS